MSNKQSYNKQSYNKQSYNKQSYKLHVETPIIFLLTNLYCFPLFWNTEMAKLQKTLKASKYSVLKAINIQYSTGYFICLK